MMLLRDESVEPTEKVLKNVLGNIHPLYSGFISRIKKEPLSLNPQWKYYKDGHAWLCTLAHKKKTVSWMSIGEGYFKVTTYFSGKHLAEIHKLPIKKKLITEFEKTGIDRKYSHFAIEISSMEHLNDLYTVMEYKKNH